MVPSMAGAVRRDVQVLHGLPAYAVSCGGRMAVEHGARNGMTGRLIRFPIADPLETALVAATELDREQLEQLRDQVAALLAALSPPVCAPVERVRAKTERSPFLVGLPEGPRGGGSIEWKRIRHSDKVYGPYPYLRVRLGGRQRSIYLKALAHATRESASRDGQVSPSA